MQVMLDVFDSGVNRAITPAGSVYVYMGLVRKIRVRRRKLPADGMPSETFKLCNAPKRFSAVPIPRRLTPWFLFVPALPLHCGRYAMKHLLHPTCSILKASQPIYEGAKLSLAPLPFTKGVMMGRCCA